LYHKKGNLDKLKRAK